MVAGRAGMRTMVERSSSPTPRYPRRRSPSGMIGLSLEDTESSLDPILISSSSSDHHKASCFPPLPTPREASASPSPEKTGTSLEERVRELETKLAVLSRLLQFHSSTGSLGQQQQQHDHRTASHGTTPRVFSRSPPPVPPAVPLRRRFSENQAVHNNNNTNNGSALSTPELTTSSSNGPSAAPETEKRSNTGAGSNQRGSPPPRSQSPADSTHNSNDVTPPTEHHKRNLSFSLLFDGNEAEYDQNNRLLESRYLATESMTPAERQWLQPKILQYQKDRYRNESQTSLIPDPPSSQRSKSQGSGKHQPSPSSGNSLVSDDPVRNNWLNYLNSFQDTNVDVDVQMQEFIQVPRAMESLMSFGLFICVDSFLHMITVLPIRFVWSCFLLLLKVGVWLRTKQRASAPYRFHRRHTYQLIQVMLLYTIYRYVLSAISIGIVYHWIRGQSMIKLYVLVAMVEVFDRLFASLGQDALESMYWNTVNRPKSSRMVVSVVVVWVYAVLHSLLLFGHVATLNVAMNSADQALLTLLISGNFAEIKSTVFKKYNKPALFKIAASDICERFKLGLFLSLVLLLNVCQGMDPAQSIDYVRICGYVWCAELISDWIKHSFITKFNFLPARVYPEYALLLAGDVTGIGHEGVNLDHSHAVVKRIGFAQIPLVCVMFRMLREATKYAQLNPYWQGLWSGTTSWGATALCVAGWLVLLAVKLALGSLLQRTSLAKLQAAPQVLAMEKKDKKKKS